MKSGEFLELNQTRDDHLDINVRCMMAQIDQAERLWSKFACTVIACSPIVNDRRVECRLVKLMFHKDAPVVRQRSVNLAHAFEVPFQCVAQMLLAREVATISNPDSVR